MTAPTPATSSDYLYVDGTESITLASATESITVAHAKRSRVSAGSQLSGMDAGGILFDLAMAEVTGAIDEPTAGMTITDSDNRVYVVDSVLTLVISEIWQCVCRIGE